MKGAVASCDVRRSDFSVILDSDDDQEESETGTTVRSCTAITCFRLPQLFGRRRRWREKQHGVTIARDIRRGAFSPRDDATKRGIRFYVVAHTEEKETTAEEEPEAVEEEENKSEGEHEEKEPGISEQRENETGEKPSEGFSQGSEADDAPSLQTENGGKIFEEGPEEEAPGIPERRAHAKGELQDVSRRSKADAPCLRRGVSPAPETFAKPSPRLFPPTALSSGFRSIPESPRSDSPSSNPSPSDCDSPRPSPTSIFNLSRDLNDPPTPSSPGRSPRYNAPPAAFDMNKKRRSSHSARSPHEATSAAAGNLNDPAIPCNPIPSPHYNAPSAAFNSNKKRLSSHSARSPHEAALAAASDGTTTPVPFPATRNIAAVQPTQAALARQAGTGHMTASRQVAVHECESSGSKSAGVGGRAAHSSSRTEKPAAKRSSAEKGAGSAAVVNDIPRAFSAESSSCSSSSVPIAYPFVSDEATSAVDGPCLVAHSFSERCRVRSGTYCSIGSSTSGLRGSETREPLGVWRSVAHDGAYSRACWSNPSLLPVIIIDCLGDAEANMGAEGPRGWVESNDGSGVSVMQGGRTISDARGTTTQQEQQQQQRLERNLKPWQEGSLGPHMHYPRRMPSPCDDATRLCSRPISRHARSQSLSSTQGPALTGKKGSLAHSSSLDIRGVASGRNIRMNIPRERRVSFNKVVRVRRVILGD